MGKRFLSAFACLAVASTMVSLGAPEFVSGQGSDGAPALEKLGGPEGPIKRHRATFRFSVEPGAQVECRLNFREPEPCESPRTFKGLDFGHHNFTVTASDGVGNVSEIRWHIRVLEPSTEKTAVDGVAVTDLRAGNSREDLSRFTLFGAVRNFRNEAIEPANYPVYFRLGGKARRSIPLGKVGVRQVKRGQAAPFEHRVQVPRRAKPGHHEIVVCQPRTLGRRCGRVLASVDLPVPRPASLAVDPTEVIFPSTVVDHAEFVTLFVENEGQLDPGVVTTRIEGPDADNFGGGQNNCSQVEGGRNCFVEMDFEPLSPGPKSATLVIDPEIGRTVEVPLSGTGVAP